MRRLEFGWLGGWAVFLAVAVLPATIGAQPERPPQDAQGTDFYVVNNGPRAIEEVFVSPTGDRNWGRDRLSRGGIPAEDTQLLRETVREGCQGDVRVVFEGGGQMERRNQNLCRINKMYFNSPEQPGRRRPAPGITIRNDSEMRLEKVYITRAGDRNWGRSWIDSDEPIGAKSRRPLQIGMELGCQIDVRAIFPGEQHVEYYNENICAEPTLVFFAPQLEPGRPQLGPQAERRDPDPNPNSSGEPRESDPRSADRPEAGSPGGRSSGGSGNVTVVNTYRMPLRELFISPAAMQDWGSDLLPDRVLVAPQDRYAVRIDTGRDCQFNIKAVWDSDAEQTLRNQNLCNARPVTLRGPPPGEKLWTGTGFYVSRAGHVLTNKHVIYGCASVVISRPGGGNVVLRVLARDPDHDLALLQETNPATSPVTFRAPITPLRAGEPSISLGYPIRELLGSLIVTSGIISSLSGGRGDEAKFQMQTPIQPGNSGGPVFDEAGLLIGVSTAQITRAGNRAVQNVSFAIKSEIARKFLDSQNIKPDATRLTSKLTPADITEQQQKSVLPLTCYN
ncbi:MAG: serine protease [Acetobacteraceae bacterium]|nr:serine protease [Acetobacteraceae bacterium]